MKLLASLVRSGGSALHALWSAPAVLFSAFLIAWGAEAAQFMMSQGLALAILAWLQTLPEFAVEAKLAWDAGRGTPDDVHLVTANFTGSIRLIMGFGMPMVYFISTRFWSRTRTLAPIELDRFHSVEIVSLFPPIIYFIYILHKGTLDIVDSIVLLGFYALYLGLLMRMPPEEEGDISELPAVSRWILRRGRVGRIAGVIFIFVLGGAILFLTVHEFIESLKLVAPLVGLSAFFFIQWIAPFLSEMPEKVSAFAWASKAKRAPMALMNFLSSNINQLTVLVAMVPLVFALSAWMAPPDPTLIARTAAARVDPFVGKQPEITPGKAEELLLEYGSVTKVAAELHTAGRGLDDRAAEYLRGKLRDEMRAAAEMRDRTGMPTLVFNQDQLSEVLLTVVQAALCLVLLLNMRFEWWDAVGMFFLFIVQFLSPLWAKLLGLSGRHADTWNEQFRIWVCIAYLGWIAIEVVLVLARVRRWQFPMLARPSRTIFRRRKMGPAPPTTNIKP